MQMNLRVITYQLLFSFHFFCFACFTDLPELFEFGFQLEYTPKRKAINSDTKFEITETILMTFL